jgi:DNA-binding GntR family transcriptional regulator
MDTHALDLKPLPKTDGLGAKEWVYLSLRNALLNGRIEPGLPLTIRGLAEALDVSPMPVREALYRLTCEGAVEVKNNRRVIVPEMSAEKLQALFDMRMVLETHAASDALLFMTQQHIAELERLDNLVDEAVDAGDVDRITPANQAFHRYLYTIPPAQVVMPMIESVWLQLGPFVRVVRSRLERCYVVDRHQETLAALRAGDETALQQAIRDDIRDGMGVIESVDGLDGLLVEAG